MSECINLISENKGQLKAKLAKNIDENSSFVKMLNFIVESKSTIISIDCSELTYLNSSGIRSLINFIEELSSLSVKIIYTHCSTTLVSQFNMVKGFFPKSTNVESFYCPYFNPVTDEEKVVLVFSKDVLADQLPIVTDENGNEFEFDGFQEKYFSFLNSL